jgi:aryl-alcohol dehydrogenase-like predicted oxidoreductase
MQQDGNKHPGKHKMLRQELPVCNKEVSPGGINKSQPCKFKKSPSFDMKYKLLGRSTLEISQIAFGCMSLGNDENENERLVNKAIEMGVNFFDTADIYGNGQNEESLGRIIKSKRSDLIIATKVGNQLRSDGSGTDWNPRKAYILESVNGSLKRLQTDYIDLYQLHGGTIEDPIDEAIEASRCSGTKVRSAIMVSRL